MERSARVKAEKDCELKMAKRVLDLKLRVNLLDEGSATSMPDYLKENNKEALAIIEEMMRVTNKTKTKIRDLEKENSACTVRNQELELQVA